MHTAKRTMILLAGIGLSGCMPGTAIIEGIQGEDATQAGHELAVERHMVTDCRTLQLQERSLRGAVKNPLRNVSGGAMFGQDYKAIVEAIRRKGCTA